MRTLYISTRALKLTLILFSDSSSRHSHDYGDILQRNCDTSFIKVSRLCVCVRFIVSKAGITQQVFWIIYAYYKRDVYAHSNMH